MNNEAPRIVNERGDGIKLTSTQKNAIYEKAKKLKENIRNNMCTQNELHSPTERNVNKMIHGEMAMTKQTEAFKKHMQAIGADPRDYSTERLRRR